MSDSANTAAASGRIRAPCEVYSSSAIAEPSPAPAWITHLVAVLDQLAHARRCQRDAVLVRLDLGGDADLHLVLSVWTSSSPQGEPEVDPVTRVVQRAPGQLLDAADPVAQRMTVAEERLRRALPLPVALDEGLQRAHQLAAVGALGVLDRRQDRVAEQPQRVVVLQREQQLEGAEVAVGRELRARRRRAVDGELARLERAARLVEAAPQVAGRDGPARRPPAATGRPRARRARAGARRARTARRRRPPAAARTGSARPAATSPPPASSRTRARERLLGRGARAARRREHERAGALAQPERLQPPRELGPGQVARRPARSARRRPAAARCRRRRAGATARARRS